MREYYENILHLYYTTSGKKLSSKYKRLNVFQEASRSFRCKISFHLFET